ncbi:MAG TPA: barstar family protein, partial [Ornithinibacter sp.]|nr:barstar family protein [Ornithinibacter sp.]
GREVEVVHAGPTKEATLAAFAEALDFPAWFGGNLDALADCLGHLARTAPGETELVVDGVAELAREDPFAWADLRGLLGELASSHPRFHVTVIDR